MLNLSVILRVLAIVAFALAIFGVPYPALVEISAGLGLYVGSTLA